MRRPVLATGAIAVAAVLNPSHAEDDPDRTTEARYVVKTFVISDRGDLPALRLADATVSLIGEPDANSFGLSFRGTLTPEVEMTGDEKLVLYLYIHCDDQIPSKTKGINVGTVDLGTLKKGNEAATLIVTANASAFVPLSHIECAKMALN